MAVQLLGQILVLRLVTTWLDRDEYGRLALCASAEALIMTALMSPLLQGMSRLVPEAVRTGGVDRMVALVATMARNVFGVIGLAALTTAAYLMLQGRPRLVPLALGVAWLAFADYRANRTQYLALAARLRVWLAVHRAADAAARALVVVLVVRRVPLAATVLFTWGAASLASNFFIEGRVRAALRSQCSSPVEDAKSDSTTGTRRRILTFGTPLGVAAAVTWMNTSLDRWIVEHYSTVADAGTYAAATQLSNMPFALLANLLMQFAWPILYARVDRKERDSRTWLLRMTLSYLVIGLVGGAVLILLRTWLTRLLLGPSQWPAAELMPVTAAAAFLFNLSQMMAVDLMVLSDTRRLIVPTMAGGLAIVVAGPLLVARHGAIGAAWAVAIAGGLRVLMMLWANDRAWRAWHRRLDEAQSAP